MADGTVERFAPATDTLIEHLTRVAIEYTEGFETLGDSGVAALWALNLTSFMGERMGTVLRRLHDAERQLAEVGRGDEACNDCGEYDLRLTEVPDPSGGKPIRLCSRCLAVQTSRPNG